MSRDDMYYRLGIGPYAEDGDSRDKLRGHPIEWVDGEWVYSDTKEPTQSSWQTRACGYCGKNNTAEGHDGCIGTLSGVMNACCGHGEVSEAYVQFNSGNIVGYPTGGGSSTKPSVKAHKKLSSARRSASYYGAKVMRVTSGEAVE